MSLTNFPNGITSFGIPVVGSGILTSGSVYWVSSTTGSNGNSGTEPSRPFATIDYAIGRCTANKGDVILVMPGHTESVTAAGGIDCDVAGISIIGLGNGSNRPKISFSTSTSADIDIDAANVRIKNIVFDLTGIDALAAPIDVNAANFTLEDCEIIIANATAQATLAILTDANASGMVVKNCLFYGSDDAGATAAIRLVGGSNILIKDNIFVGSYGAAVGAISNITTAVTNLYIIGNHIHNRTSNSTKAITLLDGTVGFIANNRMQILSGTAPISAAGCSWVGGNYYANAVATGGTLI